MELNTIEKFLLIAHHPEKWWFKITQIHLKYGIAGAMLLELALRKNIILNESKILVNPESKPGDKDYPIFEEIVQTIELSRRLHKPKYWIQKYGRRSRKLKWEFLNGLEKKRLIRINELKFLFIPYRRVYLIDKHARVMLITKLRDSLMYKRIKTEDDIAILGLVEACKMYRIIEPDRSKRRTIRKELKEVIKESPISEILASTIKQIQVAIAMAVAASSAGAGASH
jgi:golgi phosphoprotein 3